MATEDLLDALCTIDEAPWLTIGKDDTPLNALRLAAMLGDYGIKPAPKVISGYADGKCGYERADFKDAWLRYPSLSDDSSHVQDPQEPHGQGVSDDSQPASGGDDLHNEKPPKPPRQGNIADLADRNSDETGDSDESRNCVRCGKYSTERNNGQVLQHICHRMYQREATA